jgi:hypothetical protein
MIDCRVIPTEVARFSPAFALRAPRRARVRALIGARQKQRLAIFAYLLRFIDLRNDHSVQHASAFSANLGRLSVSALSLILVLYVILFP